MLSCKEAPHPNTSVKNEGNIDSIISLKNAISMFRDSEHAALDSIAKYRIKEIYDTCIKYLYVLNGMKTFSDNLHCKGKLTISACKIKIRAFESQSIYLKNLIFGVFAQDSIPCRLHLQSDSGEVISGFTIDVNKMKVLFGLIGESGRINFNEIQHSYQLMIESPEFKNYLKASEKNIHPDFKSFFAN